MEALNIHEKSARAIFEKTPGLHGETAKCIVSGNTVIDHETVTGLPNGTVVESIAIYEIVQGLIRNVTFLQ